MIFQGSTRAEQLADHYTRLSLEAQSEGFRSKDELDTAIGMAKERAKQMDQPGKQLIGPVSSPYEGPKFTPNQEEVAVAGKLVERKIKAAHEGNPTKIRSADQALKEHETILKEKAGKQQQKFVPKNSPEALKKDVKRSQGLRGKLA
jgi:hypothetical protein